LRDFTGEELFDSLQTDHLTGLEMAEHNSQQTQSFLRRYGYIIQCLNNDPNLLIDSIDSLLLKEFLPHKSLKNLANTKNDLINLSVS
jgi:hypothetical protein